MSIEGSGVANLKRGEDNSIRTCVSVSKRLVHTLLNVLLSPYLTCLQRYSVSMRERLEEIYYAPYVHQWGYLPFGSGVWFMFAVLPM